MKLVQHVNQGRLVYLSNSEDQISIYENDHYRWLMFDDVIQSIMHLRQPGKLTLPHQYAALMPLLFFKPENIIELGLGGGNLSRFIQTLAPATNIVSVELSKHVIDCYSKFFQTAHCSIIKENTDALSWLTDNQFCHENDIDWVICDVYQHHTRSFQSRVELLTAMIDKLANNACLTINLPDLDDHEINLCLTILKQLQASHQIIYFHIPRYLNIVIHLVPSYWPTDNLKKRSKNSYLPKWQYTRWRQLFSHHIVA